MDLAAIRADLADTLDGFDFNVYDDVMTTPMLPAVVIGLPSNIEYSGLRDSLVTLPIHVIVSTADPVEAQDRISQALTSRGPVESILDALRTATSNYFKALKIVNVGNFAIMPDVNNGLGCDISVQVLTTNAPPSVGS